MIQPHSSHKRGEGRAVLLPLVIARGITKLSIFHGIVNHVAHARLRRSRRRLSQMEAFAEFPMPSPPPIASPAPLHFTRHSSLLSRSMAAHCSPSAVDQLQQFLDRALFAIRRGCHEVITQQQHMFRTVSGMCGAVAERIVQMLLQQQQLVEEEALQFGRACSDVISGQKLLDLEEHRDRMLSYMSPSPAAELPAAPCTELPAAPCSDGQAEVLVKDATTVTGEASIGGSWMPINSAASKQTAEVTGVRVWARKVPGSDFMEVRCNSVLDASPETVLGLLQSNDEAVIQSYNPLYASGFDLQCIGEHIKVSYARVRAAVPGLKPRDMVTMSAMHEWPEIGATALIMKAVEHHAAPLVPGVVRAKVLRGLHLLQSIPGSPHKTNFTMTQHFCPGNINCGVPSALIARSSVQFVNRLERAAIMV